MTCYALLCYAMLQANGYLALADFGFTARAGECGKDRAPIPGRGWKPRGASSDWQTGWHVYAVEWRPDRLDYFVRAPASNRPEARGSP